jgi:hypothetical protein
MRGRNFALQLQPSLLEALRSMSDLEGVTVNQLINVTIAKKACGRCFHTPRSTLIRLSGSGYGSSRDRR